LTQRASTMLGGRSRKPTSMNCSGPAVAMNMSAYGQAIGIAAAMCLRYEETPRTLNVSDLTEALPKDGAVM
jgi:hypothetical protein